MTLDQHIDDVFIHINNLWTKYKFGEKTWAAMVTEFPGYCKEIDQLNDTHRDSLTHDMIKRFEYLHVNMFRHYHAKKLGAEWSA